MRFSARGGASMYSARARPLRTSSCGAGPSRTCSAVAAWVGGRLPPTGSSSPYGGRGWAAGRSPEGRARTRLRAGGYRQGNGAGPSRLRPPVPAPPVRASLRRRGWGGDACPHRQFVAVRREGLGRRTKSGGPGPYPAAGGRLPAGGRCRALQTSSSGPGPSCTCQSAAAWVGGRLPPPADGRHTGGRGWAAGRSPEDRTRTRLRAGGYRQGNGAGPYRLRPPVPAPPVRASLRRRGWGDACPHRPMVAIPAGGAGP